MTPSTRERTLTPTEKDDRTQVLLALLDEQDTIRYRVRASRDELREWRVEARTLAARIDQVRGEIRSGVVVESAQPELPHMDTRVDVDPAMAMSFGGNGARRIIRESEMGIDGSSDSPDPETDPPPPEADRYRMFNQMYPKAKTRAELHQALRLALGDPEWTLLSREGLAVVDAWHPDSGIFEAVAHWARTERARADTARPGTPGLTVPICPTMPAALAQALAVSVPKAGKKKRTRRGKA